MAILPVTVVLEATRESEMNTTSGRTCLILALLSLSLAAAMSIGLNARHNGVTVQAHTAVMQLQGGPEADEGSVAPDADEDDKSVTCRHALRTARRQSRSSRSCCPTTGSRTKARPSARPAIRSSPNQTIDGTSSTTADPQHKKSKGSP